jgi:hypothetical protein
MRKVALFSTLILLLSFAPPSWAGGGWGGGGGGWHGGGGWGWHGGGCCGGVFIGFGGFGYGGYPYAYAPYPYPPYPYYPPYPASPAAYSGSGTVTPSATTTVDPAIVRAIQAELQRAGYDVGPVDGRLGPRTREAIRQYEQQNGLAVDGSPSQALLDRMRAHPTG